MQRFLVQRLIITLVTLVVVSVIVFVMARASGDPRGLLLDDYAGPDQWEKLGEKLGLNKPLYQQYWIFLKDAFRGDFGESVREKRPVMELIKDPLLATFELGIAAFILSLIVGVPLGVLSSVKRNSLWDQVGKVVALLGQSLPPFWLGIMLIFFFAVKLGWVPASGREGWSSIVLPAITLGWFFVAANLRLVRSAMLDVLDSEYIKLARAKGVSTTVIIWKHALRNALIPPLTYMGITLGAAITGSLIAEVVFAWPGIGRLAVSAMYYSDYSLLQGIVIIFTVLYLAVSLLVDVLYAYVDPRIRYT